MTEDEWLNATDPTPMLEFLSGEVSDRKLRLFGIACCRHIWPLLTDERSRSAVEVGERFADRLVSVEELNTARSSARQAWADYGGRMAAEDYATMSVENVTFPVNYPESDLVSYGPASSVSYLTSAAIGCRQTECHEHARFLRELFGNPFRPVTLDPTWLTSTVHAIADGIYSEKDFDRMPILADALQEEGCDNEDILNHCRQPGEHVRGCWALDLVLGRE